MWTTTTILASGLALASATLKPPAPELDVAIQRELRAGDAYSHLQMRNLDRAFDENLEDEQLWDSVQKQDYQQDDARELLSDKKKNGKKGDKPLETAIIRNSGKKRIDREAPSDDDDFGNSDDDEAMAKRSKIKRGKYPSGGMDGSRGFIEMQGGGKRASEEAMIKFAKRVKKHDRRGVPDDDDDFGNSDDDVAKPKPPTSKRTRYASGGNPKVKIQKERRRQPSSYFSDGPVQGIETLYVNGPLLGERLLGEFQDTPIDLLDEIDTSMSAIQKLYRVLAQEKLEIQSELV